MTRIPPAALAALAAALVALPAAARERPAAPPVTLDGKRFTVVVEGKGPDVVLVPGLASPRAVWDGTRKALAGRYRLHLVQVRGFAGDDPGRNATGPVLEPFVKELADYIDDEIVDRGRPAPALVGHSMGGLAALMIAERAPRLVGRLMIVDALPFIGTLYNPAATVDLVRPYADQARAAALAAPVAKAPVTADPKSIWSITPAGRIQVAEWGRLADPRVTAQALYDDMTTDARPALATVAARPFTVLYAAGAGPQATAIWERAYAGSPARLVPVPGSYHFIMLDQPAAFAKALEEFLPK